MPVSSWPFGPTRRRVAWRRRVLLAAVPCAALLFGVGVRAVAASDAAETSIGASADGPSDFTAGATRLSHARVLPYPLATVWPTGIRYLRVDRGYTLVDRDEDAGFILFDFPVGERFSRGSLEIFATKDASGRDAVRLEVSTDAGPTHLPHAIAEGLAHKLRVERGPPATPPQPKPPDKPDKKPPSGGGDEDDGPTEPPLVLSPDGPG